MEERCRKEIERLHRFFVEWFCGTVPKDHEYFEAHASCAFSPDMSMITPAGVVVTRPALMDRLRQGYGCHAVKKFSIDVRDIQVIHSHNDEYCLLTYQEWQQLGDDDTETTRISTALFRSTTSDCPHGVQWVHLQETWVEDNTTELPKEEGTSSEPAPSHSLDTKTRVPVQPSSALNRPSLTREASLVSKRRHLYPKIDSEFEEIEMISNTDGEIAGINIEGWKITTQQGSIADEAWLSQATERLSELSQPKVSSRSSIERNNDAQADMRRLNLPEMVFSHAHVSLVHEERQLKVTFGAYAALRAWALAHTGIPLQSKKSHRGVSVLQSIDAALWLQRKRSDSVSNSSGDIVWSNFHYDWTFSTPHASSSTMDITWHPLEESGINQSLLQDQSIPILLFDDVLLYEDDLHDNGEVKLSVKVRVMPTCIFCLEHLWLRVDGVLLRVRDTRVMFDFGKEGEETAVYRDISWRECPWAQLEVNGLPSDVRSWCVPQDGSAAESRAFQEQLQKIPSVPLPTDLPAHSVMNE